MVLSSICRDATPKSLKALVVCRRPESLSLVGGLLNEHGFEVLTECTAFEGSAAARWIRPDVVFIENQLPDQGGLSLLDSLRRDLGLTLPVVIMSEDPSVDEAVASMKMGAFDYLPLPAEGSRVIALLSVLVDREGGTDDAEAARLGARLGMIGGSFAMLQAFRAVAELASSDSPVMIRGEAGAGKKTFARAIHGLGQNRSEPFLTLDCGCISPDMVEGELFGSTLPSGGLRETRREGLLSLAGKGSVFLERFHELPLTAKRGVLRAMHTREVRPRGSGSSEFIEARLICGACAGFEWSDDLKEDLVYGLDLVTLEVPPLRDRREDIPSLSHHFLTRHCPEFPKSFSPEALTALCEYPWPGNVRQLENVVKRALRTGGGFELGLKNLPQEILRETGFGAGGSCVPEEDNLLEAYEKRAILAALSRAEGNRRRAARLLGISKTTLYAKMRKLRLEGACQLASGSGTRS